MPATGTDPVYAAFGRAIRFHYRRIHMLLDALGVYPGQPPLLFMLGKSGPLSHKELAQRLYVKPATITVMLGRMARAGLVAQRGDPTDRRISTVRLTPQGQALRRKVKKALMVIAAECFDDFTPAQRRQLQGLLEQLRANLERACLRIEHQRTSGSKA